MNEVVKRRKCAPDCNCGRHTASIARRKPKVGVLCGFCNSEFFVIPARSAKAKYCSVSCFNSAIEKRKADRRATGKAYFHDMTVEEFERRLREQNGVCAICCEKINGREAQRDHCHTTGEWRGLLCGKCNRALGLFGDDPVRLLRAADYLIKGGVDNGHCAAEQ